MTSFLNNTKTAILLGALMGLFVAVGYVLGNGSPIWMGMGLLFGGVTNLGAWFFSDRIAIAAMQAKEIDERSHPQIYGMVRELAVRASLPMPRVYISPHQAPNAFATGRSPSRAAVCFTEGCLALLDRHELEGVAAHELAHIKNRDTLISTIAATVAGVLAFLAQMIFWIGLGGGNREQNPLVLIGVVLIAAIGAAILKSMISRSREFVADADGAAIAGSPHGLVGALRKLEAYSQRIPLQQPNPAQNSLFIVEPFGGSKTLMSLFASHPPTEARIAALLRG